MVFVRKLKQRMLAIRIGDSSASSNVSVYKHAIFIEASLLAARILRLFSQSVSGIDLQITGNANLRKEFFAYTNKCCHKTLNSFQIFGDHSHIFGEIKYPFGNVEEFSFVEAGGRRGCQHLNRLFPRLRQLILQDSHIMELKYIYEKFSCKS